MVLPYKHIKEIHNSHTINPFFGKWTSSTTPPTTLDSYRWILDTITKVRYERPQIKTDTMMSFAPYFVTKTGDKIFRPDVIRASVVYTHANTSENPILIISTPDVASSSTNLAAAAYAVFMGNAATETPLTPSDKQIHWVWFRKPAYCLTAEIFERASSWIECNVDDGFQFHLWTNLADAAESDEFLADIPKDMKDRYLPHIQIHYKTEFYETIRNWIYTHCSAETQTVFENVWNSSEKQDIVMKTDYTRNILLAVHGGIYADFNDLLCLAPVAPFLVTHAGSFTGVTDTLADSHASNYFLYASRHNPEWQALVIRCTETLPTVHGVIYDTESLDVARTLLRGIIETGSTPDLPTIQRQLNRVDFPLSKPQHYVYAMAMALGITRGSSSMSNEITVLLQRFNRPQFVENVIKIIQSATTDKETLLASLSSEEFAAAWRYARTDMYLSWIMYHSNLPIYCRQMKIPIPMVPFGYLLRYSCLLSFIGHLGDGTSYGRPPSQKTTMRQLLNL